MFSRHPQRPLARSEPEKPKQLAKTYALWLLSRREYSAANLKKKLLQRGYEAPQVEEAMQFVIENRYQSDERFAGMTARQAERRAGNRRIAMKLKQKGVADDVAKAQLEELAPEEDRAVQAASRFEAEIEISGMTPPVRQKIYRFLSYRCFSIKAIRHTIDHLSAIALDRT